MPNLQICEIPSVNFFSLPKYASLTNLSVITINKNTNLIAIIAQNNIIFLQEENQKYLILHELEIKFEV